MSANIGRRLDRLAAISQGRGCETCQPWHTTAVLIISPDAGGSVAPLPAAPPARCPVCGRRTPAITQTVIIAPEVDDDAGIAGE